MGHRKFLTSLMSWDQNGKCVNVKSNRAVSRRRHCLYAPKHVEIVSARAREEGKGDRERGGGDRERERWRGGLT